MSDMLRFPEERGDPEQYIAPKILKSVTTKGVTAPPTITSFASGDIKPHITLAPNIEACPFQQNFSISISSNQRIKTCGKGTVFLKRIASC